MNLLRGHYKGFLLVFLGIVLAVLLSRSVEFHGLVSHLGVFGYVGAFVAGMLFVSTFTLASAILILIVLGQHLPPLQVSLIAGIGATVGNYLIFLFIKEKVTTHFRLFSKKGKKKHVWQRFFHSHSHWVLPFAGILIMASPLPDELGILLLSIFRMKTYQFLLLSFTLKTAGIFALLANAHYFS